MDVGVDRDLQLVRKEVVLGEVRAAQLQAQCGHQAAAVPQRRARERFQAEKQ